jgi:Protein of unknown function (DUF669)
MSINWTDLAKVAGDGGFTVLPNGEYDAYVNSAQGGKTSTNKDRIRVTFKVENGPHAGQVVVNDFVITADNANAMSIFFRNMTALGLPAEYFAAHPHAPVDKVAADLQAKRSRCRLRLSSRTWQGQERNNVDAILPALPGTAPSAPPAPSVHVPPTPHVASVPVPSVPNLPDDLPF